MVLIDEILKCHSLSIVGLEKNTGKTECLNYILSRVKDSGKRFAVTSIGVDGESRDQICQSPKPEIELFEGMLFVTSEKHYREKRLTAEILDVSEVRTSLGRLVTAQVVNSGKVLLSGPVDTFTLKTLIGNVLYFGADHVIIDGALSRLSLAAPAVTDAMILTTGAAVSRNIPQLVRKTRYVYDLICLGMTDQQSYDKLHEKEEGVWAIDENGEEHDLHIPSVFMLDKYGDNIFKYGRRIYVAGAVSDKLLEFMRMQKEPVELIARDFTRIFARPESFYAFIRQGGSLKVLLQTRLLAVCINPQSPDGYCLDSDILREAMQQELDVPVFDIRKI